MKYNYMGFIYIIIILSVSINSIAVQNSPLLLNQEVPKIVTSLNFLADFVDALYKGSVEVTGLITANQDPHFYEPSIDELTALSEADLILAIGSPEFDEWLTGYIDNSGDLTLQNKLEFAGNTDELEEIDPLTGVANPHFWLDPNNAKILVNNIADILLERNLIEDVTVNENLPIYLGILDELNVQIEQSRLIYEGTKVVVDHPSFFYFLRRLGIERVGTIEEKQGEEPSPQNIQDLVKTMKEQDVELIVASAIQAGSDVKQLARETGAKIAYLTPLPGVAGQDTYLEMMQYNLNQLDNPVAVEENGLDFPIFFIIPFILIPILVKKLRRIN